MGKIIKREEEIISQIYLIRGKKVMLDSDLARLYGVTTRRLNEQVKRNIDRFPADFMFEISKKDYQILMSQFATSSCISSTKSKSYKILQRSVLKNWGGRRKMPYVFTEYGTLMLASILNSQTAVKASIFVVRTFVKLREILSLHYELAEKIEDLERRIFDKLDEHDKIILEVFAALREIVSQKNEPRNPIGYKIRSGK